MRPARPRARAAAGGALAALLLAALTACGGSGGEGGDGGVDVSGQETGILDPSPDPDAGVAPEDVRLSASEVAAGLRVVRELADSATKALGPNDLGLTPEDAPALQAQLAPSWATVARTVKENDAATHAALEEAFPAFGAAIGAGDQGAARTAADRIAAAVDAYLARFPSGPGAEMPAEPSGDGSMPAFDHGAPPEPTASPDADAHTGTDAGTHAGAQPVSPTAPPGS